MALTNAPDFVPRLRFADHRCKLASPRVDPAAPHARGWQTRPVSPDSPVLDEVKAYSTGSQVDRKALVKLVAARSSLSKPEAEQRVDTRVKQ